MNLPASLLGQIYDCANQLPTTIINSLVKVLTDNGKSYCNNRLKRSILEQLSNPNFRRIISKLLDTWQKESIYINAQTLATAIYTVKYCQTKAESELSVELVWTGPVNDTIPLRRTDQVLLQLIREVKQELTIISFAIYKIPEISQALKKAINRGVNVRLIAETPETSEGKISFGFNASFDKEIIEKSQIFNWSLDKRTRDTEGRHGSLHAKCAIADSEHIFISSANLTEYAFTLNMEIGILVHSQKLASQVLNRVNSLIEYGTLTLL
ncbi:MAG: DISARM system phospholipase D-like protein DrmC [Cyanobacteria bacterium P01_A01_bin.68]